MLDRLIESRKRAAASEGGFTLIELLVVIVILGILAAVVVFSVAGLNDRGERSACEIDTRTLNTAQEAYFATRDKIVAGTPIPNNTYAASTQALADAGFLSEASELHETTNDVNGDSIVDDPAAFEVRVLDAQCGVPGEAVGGTNL